MHDVAVIGAGPSGLICAADLEKLGEEVIVIEKDKKVGEPIECAGLFNIDGLKRLGIGKGDYILNEVKGARFISAGGAVAEVKGKESKAYVTDRGDFDRFLAEKFGSELVLGEEVSGAKKTKGGHQLATQKNRYEATRVVVATGYSQTVHHLFGLRGPERFVSTSQYEIKGMNVDPDFVELYVGSAAPGFFAWVIPTGGDTARVGLGVAEPKESTHKRMELFLKRLKAEGKFKARNSVVRKSGGLIPFYEPGLRLEKDGVYLVGDAAGQVKATTGGGVMIGGLAAKELASAMHEGGSYEAALCDIDKELGNHLLIRKVLNRFGDEQYEHIVEFLNKPEIKKLLEERGDMDFVGPVIEGVMSNPLLMLSAAKFLGRGLLF
jgi:geranylgeranyl reductase family protein